MILVMSKRVASVDTNMDELPAAVLELTSRLGVYALSFLMPATIAFEGSKGRLVIVSSRVAAVSNRVPLPASSGTPAAGGLLYG
jgi:hypothetical protein